MFASKEACVREIVGRVLDSRLNDEEAVSAVFNLIKAYRENPDAFGNFQTMVEPLDLSAAFQWDGAGPEGIAYWQNVNSALVGVFHEISEAGDHPVGEDFKDEAPTTYYDAIGPMVEGWGLLNREKGITLPVFHKTRKDARSAKLQDTVVVRVAMFTIDEK
jgi:hypothetical protein